MTAITVRIEDDIARAIDAEIKQIRPRVSRTALVEHILFERYQAQIEAFRDEQCVDVPSSEGMRDQVIPSDREAR